MRPYCIALGGFNRLQARRYRTKCRFECAKQRCERAKSLRRDRETLRRAVESAARLAFFLLFRPRIAQTDRTVEHQPGIGVAAKIPEPLELNGLANDSRFQRRLKLRV